jgi:hypothetical protein
MLAEDEAGAIDAVSLADAEAERPSESAPAGGAGATSATSDRPPGSEPEPT